MTGAIIQARMKATRLPGKVMKEVLGRPLLFYLLERLRQSKLIEKIIVATTTEPADQTIFDYTKNLDIDAFCGSEKDVLDRYYQAACQYAIDTIVRITADCPLLDPEVMDEVIRYFLEHQDCDLVCTGPTYPEGLDTEVLPFKSLEVAWKEARLRPEREHVIPFVWKNEKRFKVKTLVFHEDLSYLRLSVDGECDFVVVRNVIENLYPRKRNFRLQDILELYKKRPELFAANRNAIRNEGLSKSLRQLRGW